MHTLCARAGRDMSREPKSLRPIKPLLRWLPLLSRKLKLQISSLRPNSQEPGRGECRGVYTPGTMSDTESQEGGRISPSLSAGGRHEKSLGILTAKFVELLQSADGGVLDLKKVSGSLGVPNVSLAFRLSGC